MHTPRGVQINWNNERSVWCASSVQLGESVFAEKADEQPRAELTHTGGECVTRADASLRLIYFKLLIYTHKRVYSLGQFLIHSLYDAKLA
jgi:hypothetical protein